LMFGNNAFSSCASRAVSPFQPAGAFREPQRLSSTPTLPCRHHLRHTESLIWRRSQEVVEDDGFPLKVGRRPANDVLVIIDVDVNERFLKLLV
jgi:hypothetical protein